MVNYIVKRTMMERRGGSYPNEAILTTQKIGSGLCVDRYKIDGSDNP